MFVLTSSKQIEKAVAKAKQVHVKVKFVEFGKYLVSGSQGNLYAVRMVKNPLGQKEVHCECKGAEKGLVCYHSAAALSLHCGLARQRQTAN